MSICRTAAFGVATLLFLLPSPGWTQGAGTTQDLLVSTGVVGLNRLPTVATDPTTGNIFVAWARLTAAGTTSEVWGMLLRRSASGTYTVKKAFRLSAATGFNTNPSVAWLPKRKRFFVAWDTAPIFLRRSQIQGRLINRQGLRPQGRVKTIVSGSFFNQLPIVTASVVGGVQDVRIFYTRAPNATGIFIGPPAGVGDVKQQVVSQKLKNATLRARGAADVHVSSNNLPEGARVLSWDRASPFDCGILLVSEVVGGRTVWFLDLIVNGRVVAKARTSLGAASSVWLTSLGTRDGSLQVTFLAGRPSGATIDSYTAQKDPPSINLQASKEGEKFQSLLAAMLVLDEDTSNVVRAGTENEVTFYAATAESDGWVRSRRFSQNGTLRQVGDAVELFEHGDAIQSLDAVGLPTGGRGPDAAVLWTKAISPTLQEIHAHVFTAEP